MRHESIQKSARGLLVWAAVFFVLAGCADYARFHIDDQVLKNFKSHAMINGYHYYYSGRENVPSVIIGIDPAFAFSSKLWTAIEPSQFKKMVDRMLPPANTDLYGAVILTPDGRKAGVWYSWATYYGAKFEGRRIIVYAPEPYEEPEEPILEISH